MLRWGDEVLWREPAFWEDYETFLTVADVLRRKYGPRLKDVVPSGSAESNMWGDRLSAPSWIEEARRRVRAGLQVLCIDIDDMVADFEAAVARLSDDDARDYAGRLDEVPGIWYRVPPRPNAIEAIRRLSASYEICLLTRFSSRDERALSARFSWAKRRLGEGARGLSLAPRGAIRLGDYLVDDRGTDDVNELADEFILFGSEAYPDWDAVVAYLEARRREYLGPAGEAGPA